VAVTASGTGVNFALFSQHGTKVTLVLYNKDGSLLGEVPVEGRTGDIWHVLVQGLPLADILYGYKVGDPGLAGLYSNIKVLPIYVLVDVWDWCDRLGW
jgi:isoamylase